MSKVKPTHAHHSGFTISKASTTTQRVVSACSSYIGARIILRKDDDVRRSQVRGYKYLLP